MSAAACPACGGLRMVGDPTGFRWDHVADCALRAADDGTVAADYLRARGGSAFSRPVTAAERALVAACGYDLATTALTTVTVITSAIRGRSWAGVPLE